MLEALEWSQKILGGKMYAKHPHIVAPLMGRFKGETGERNLLLCMVNVTASGIPVRKWLERLV